jgi:hypothetical protein
MIMNKNYCYKEIINKTELTIKSIKIKINNFKLKKKIINKDEDQIIKSFIIYNNKISKKNNIKK